MCDMILYLDDIGARMPNFYNQLLGIAVLRENLEDVKSCLLKGADVNQRLPPFNETYLHCSSSLEIMKQLINCGAHVNARDRYGQTPLYAAIANKKELKIIQLLLANGADVNARDINGETPLHCAALEGKQLPVVKELLRHHVDVNAVDNAGKTALLHAICCCEDKDLEVVKELLDYGADITAKSRPTALFVALERGFEACTKLLLKVSLLTKYDSRDLMKWVDRSNSPMTVRLLKYLSQCLAEVIRMKTDKVYGRYPLYEFIIKKGESVRAFYPSFELVKKDITLNYPIYCDIILANIKISCEKACLLKKLKGLPVFTSSDDGIKTVVLNYDCVSKIAEFIANEDLDNLVKAFHVCNRKNSIN